MESVDIVYADNFDGDGTPSVKEIFRGTEEETLAWLKQTCLLKEGDLNKAMAINFWVKVGDSEKAIHVSSYLDPKQREENRDTLKKKRDAIHELVREAMYSPDAHALEITEKIMKLYT